MYFALDAEDIWKTAHLIGRGARLGVLMVVGQLTFRPPIYLRRNVPLHLGRDDVAYKVEGRAAGATIEKLWTWGWEAGLARTEAEVNYEGVAFPRRWPA